MATKPFEVHITRVCDFSFFKENSALILNLDIKDSKRHQAESCANLVACVCPITSLLHSNQTAASCETKIKPDTGHKLVSDQKALKVRLEKE